MKSCFVSVVFILALAGQLEAQPVAAPTAKVVPLSGPQVSQVQDFSKRAAAIQKERAEMTRAWDAEFKVIQLEFQQWVDSTCRTLGGENCSANVQNEDVSKWTMTVPENKPSAVVPPKPSTVDEKKAKE